MASRDDSLLPQRDNRPGVILAHEMPDNLKIATLSDAAFRTLIKAWCYCSRNRTDGVIPTQIWATLGPTKARNELTKPPLLAPDKSPLIVPIEGGVQVHDYLAHNRSSDEIESVSSARTDSGTLGAHKRWHYARRLFVASCEHCQAERTNVRGMTNG